MPHQQQALDQTESFNRCAYYLDMGLGKTFVGAEKMYLLNNDVNLVVCQKSKIDDWLDHFEKYYPDYEVFNLTKKTQAVRFRELIDTSTIYDYKTQIVGVINYDLVYRRSYITHIRDFTLMLDESSLIQNETTQRAKFILKLQPESVVLLSGTPTSGKYEKLWSQCKLLGWDIKKKAFWASYVDTEWVEQGQFKREVVTGYKHVDHLKKKLAQHGAVFMKTQEVIELPEQIEQKIYVKPTKEYRHFMKNGYLVLDTLNLIQFKDDSDFYGNDVTPRVELVGDNGLTKTLYARQLCGQWHGFMSRGCPRGCDFCHVAPKEGKKSHKVADLSEFWNGQKYIQIMDPNTFASPDWKDICQQLIDSGAYIEFNQGVDIRIMTDEKIEMLQKMRIQNIHFAWDRYQDKKYIVPKLKRLKELTGWERGKVTVYILTNFDTTIDQDLERVIFCKSLNFTPYIMRYNKENIPRGSELNMLARYVNTKMIFWKCPTFWQYKLELQKGFWR